MLLRDLHSGPQAFYKLNQSFKVPSIFLGMTLATTILAASFESIVHFRRDVNTDLRNMINPIAVNVVPLANHIIGLTSDANLTDQAEAVFLGFITVSQQLDLLTNNITMMPSPTQINSDDKQFIIFLETFISELGIPGEELVSKQADIDAIRAQNITYPFPLDSPFDISLEQVLSPYKNSVGNFIMAMQANFPSDVISRVKNQTNEAMAVLNLAFSQI